MRQLILSCVAVILAATLGYTANHIHSTNTMPNETDIGFAQDMAVHHAQALDIAAYLLASENSVISNMATKIYHSQSREIGRFYGWLEAWGQPLISRQEMAWVNMATKHEEFQATAMDMGMANPEEMQQLANSQGKAQEILFLQLMLRHHQGGVHMASLAHRQANTRLVKGVTQLIAAEQVKEIMQMATLLQQHETAPLSYPANWRNWEALSSNP